MEKENGHSGLTEQEETRREENRREEARREENRRRRDSWFQRMLHGRILSIDFFKRNWIVVLGIVVMLMIYITSRYECQTKMERIRALETELEVAKTERVRAKSAYMSRIRESEMQEMIDSLRLGLTVQEQPPYMLSRER